MYYNKTQLRINFNRNNSNNHSLISNSKRNKILLSRDKNYSNPQANNSNNNIISRHKTILNKCFKNFLSNNNKICQSNKFLKVENKVMTCNNFKIFY